MVYNGTANNFTLTGLNPGTTYTITLFAYNTSVPCYTTSGASGTVTTSASAGTSTTDYFRSKVSGDWANATTWQSSPDNSTWVNADRVPTAASSGILIQAGHSVDITTSANMDQVQIAGTLTVSNSGVVNLLNGAGYDIDILSTGVLQPRATVGNYTTAFLISAGAQLSVATGGKITVGAGGSTSGYSPLATTSGLTVWNTGAIFEWNSTDPFLTNNVTYFPDAAPAVIPIFRVTKSPSLVPGSSSSTTWNGLMEVNANLVLRLLGDKIFRNGIIGTATLTQNDDCGRFYIGTTAGTAVTAQLGGTGVINQLSNYSVVVANGCVATLISDKTVNNFYGAGAFFQVNNGGTLMCGNFILGGSANFNLLATVAPYGTLGIGSAQGIVASTASFTGNIQTTGGRSFGAANYIYNGSVNQVTGTGLPVTINSLTINNSGIAGSNTVTLTTSNTTSASLTLTAGLYAIGSGAIFNISNSGTVTATSGDFATGVTGGTINFPGMGSFTGNCNPYIVTTSNGLDFGPNTVKIQPAGNFRINAGGYVNGTNRVPYYDTTAPSIFHRRRLWRGLRVVVRNTANSPGHSIPRYYFYHRPGVGKWSAIGSTHGRR